MSKNDPATPAAPPPAVPTDLRTVARKTLDLLQGWSILDPVEAAQIVCDARGLLRQALAAPVPAPDLRAAAELVCAAFGWHAGEVRLLQGHDGVGAIRALHAALAAAPSASAMDTALRERLEELAAEWEATADGRACMQYDVATEHADRADLLRILDRLTAGDARLEAVMGEIRATSPATRAVLERCLRRLTTDKDNLINEDELAEEICAVLAIGREDCGADRGGGDQGDRVVGERHHGPRNGPQYRQEGAGTGSGKGADEGRHRT